MVMMTSADEQPDGITEWTCHYCRHIGAIRVEWRPTTRTLIASPIGSFSLSGCQPKVTALAVREWPWAICRRDLGGCGHESRGDVVVNP
jgi:hypothetical protein